MNIIKIWDADYPWDIRVEKIARTLQKSGHSVHLVCRNLAGRKRTEQIDGFTVHRLPSFPNRRLDYMFQFPFFFNPVWLFAIFRITRIIKADIIMVRDLPMAPAALALGKLLGVPVLFDMAEDYPSMLAVVQSLAKKTKIKDLIVRNPRFATMLEDFLLSRVDHIIVVVEESRQRLIRKGVNPQKISVVSNTPDLFGLRDLKLNEDAAILREEFRGRFSIVYHGGLEPARGLACVIPALRKLLSQDINAHFFVFGDGDNSYLQPMISSYDLGNCVHFMGWWNVSNIMATIRFADVAVIPHLKTPHTDTTAPNKLFDYMSVGLPVIVSNAKPLERIVRETECGEVFRSEDSDSLAAALLKVYASSSPRFGENGREAVMERYNWKRDSNTLLEVVEGLVNGW